MIHLTRTLVLKWARVLYIFHKSFWAPVWSYCSIIGMLFFIKFETIWFLATVQFNINFLLLGPILKPMKIEQSRMGATTKIVYVLKRRVSVVVCLICNSHYCCWVFVPQEMKKCHHLWNLSLKHFLKLNSLWISFAPTSQQMLA